MNVAVGYKANNRLEEREIIMQSCHGRPLHDLMNDYLRILASHFPEECMSKTGKTIEIKL
jgi:hypothetical protein